MGDISKNCWCFGDFSRPCKRVWVVCTQCAGNRRLKRDDHWINVVPDIFETWTGLLDEIKKSGNIKIICGICGHVIVIDNPWFQRSKLKEPKNPVKRTKKSVGVEMWHEERKR